MHPRGKRGGKRGGGGGKGGQNFDFHTREGRTSTGRWPYSRDTGRSSPHVRRFLIYEPRNARTFQNFISSAASFSRVRRNWSVLAIIAQPRDESPPPPPLLPLFLLLLRRPRSIPKPPLEDLLSLPPLFTNFQVATLRLILDEVVF